MDCEIVWTGPAAADFEEIISYIAQDNPWAADKIGRKILERIDLLTKLPFLGSPFAGDPKGQVRELIYRKYRVFYRVKEALRRVEILTVRHGSRRELNIESLLIDEPEE
jgi:toxin ParE1/3/4